MVIFNSFQVMWFSFMSDISDIFLNSQGSKPMTKITSLHQDNSKTVFSCPQLME